MRTSSSSMTLVLSLALALTACDEPGGQRLPPDAGPPDARADWWFPDAGDLGVPDVIAPGSDRCAGALPAAFSGDRALITGSTAGADNEYGDAVRCGDATPLAGPQRYHALLMERGQTYRLELSPTFEAVLVIHTDCSPDVINTDCSSGGATGLELGPVQAGGSGVAFFGPPATGRYLLTVDSVGAEASGAYSLTVDRYSAPANQRCGAAEAVTPEDDGAFTVEGSTVGAADELGNQLTCGLGVDLDGPQVYYTAELDAQTWYRLTLAADFAAVLVVANTLGQCQPGNLELDCGGITGTVLSGVKAGGSGETAFSPLLSGTYVLGVDSASPDAFGGFTLSAAPMEPPANMICAAAELVGLEDGEAVVTGDTSALLNDRGAQVRCGGQAPLLGPQAYYRLALQARPYEILLTPSFDAVAAIGADCNTLPADCASSGLSGTAVAAAAGQTGSTLFTPATAGEVVLAVDSADSAAKGSFTLIVREHQPPQNGVCTAPEAIDLEALPTAVTGTTGPFQDDLAGIACGGTDGPWTGPQAYYQVALTGGTSTTVILTPEAAFDPALYAFPADTPCQASAVEAACTGLASDQVGDGVAETLTLSPASDQAYILVVDSWSPSEVGAFTLSLTPAPGP